MDPGDIHRLRTALRDLVALSTIPAAWVGREPSAVAAGLADVLVGSLHLDFAFVRLCDPNGGAAVDVTRGDAWKAFPQWLHRHLAAIGHASRKEVVPDVGGGLEPCRGLVMPIGVNADGGLVAVACDRSDFPTETDQLLLSVAANHAATAFQSARLIHERRRAEEELRQARDELEMKVAERTAELRRSEAYSAEAQRLSHTGSFGWRVSSGEIIWSEETFRIFQYDRITTPTVELILQRVHSEDAPLVKQTIERASKNGKDFDHEYRLVMPDGSIKYVHVVAHALSDESVGIEFVGAVMDVTAVKQAEEALRRSESYLAEAQRLTHTGGWAWRVAGGNALHLSEEWYRIYGFDPEEGMSAWEKRLQRVHPEDQAKWQRAIDRAIDEKSDYEVEVRILLPGGIVKYIHDVGHPVLSPSGDLVGFVGTMIDITERKRAEEERERLRQAQADLAHVNRVTTMGELTASLAHEVNQPIAAAITDAKTCMRWLAADTPNLEEARAAAVRIVKDGTRAAEIIKRTRLLFRKSTPERELVDIKEVVREMIALLHSEATRYSISIRMDLVADLPQVMGDRVQLQQVLMNLMMNGIDAMKDVEGRRELVVQSHETENNQLQVSVSDTGVGLPPNQADQIFSAFFTTKLHGTGMGLRISRSIIESHGGR